MNVIDSKSLERDAGGKPLCAFPHPALGLAVAALGLMAHGAWADEAVSPADRAQAVARMQAWTRLPARAVVAVTPDMAVALVGRGAAAGKAGQYDGVELQGEVLDEGLAQARGWRSMRLKLDIACQDGGTWARKMVVFADHDHAGAARDAAVPLGWVRPKPEAYLAQVVAAVCGVPSEALLAPHATSEAPAPKPAPTLRPAILETASDSTSPPAQITAAPPAASIATSRSGPGVTVQIAAAPTAEDARRALSGPAQRMVAISPGLNFRVEPAEVGGRSLYRALVSGFADHGSALGWCVALRKAGGVCFVR